MNNQDREHYRDIYHESGDHVRNMNLLRNTYLSLFVVALAAVIGLAGSPVGTLSRMAWWGVVAFASYGIVLMWITHDFVYKALWRQRKITQTLLSEEVFKDLRLRKLEEQTERWWTRIWWWNRRLEWFPCLLYGPVAILAVITMLWDPLGLIT